MRTLSLILVLAALLSAPDSRGQDSSRKSDGVKELAELDRQIAAKEKELAELKAKADAIRYAITAPIDLTKVDRTIAKEPTYKTKPKYCLLVFGPEAKSRVWLVLDGDVLYVDHNGNGDLTEKSERIKQVRASDETNGFPIGALSLPEDSFPKNSSGLWIYRYTDQGTATDSLRVRITINQKTWLSSFKELADRPKEAPIIHFNFDGPLSFVCPDPPTFVPGKSSRLRVYIGTPGLGEQTFSRRVDAPSIVGGGALLLAEIEYPSKEPGGKPLFATVTLPLEEEYDGPFQGLVRVPKEAGLGNAKITLLPTLLPARTVPSLAHTTLFIPVEAKTRGH